MSKSFAAGQTGYWATLAGIAIIIVAAWSMTRAAYYADFDTYVLYLDQLVHFPPANWWFFEVFSNLQLMAIHGFIQSVFPSVIVAHYLLGIQFLILLALTYRPSNAPWQSSVFLFALLGSLLAFVTLRATPAYFLVAIAVQQAREHKPRAWLFFLAALMFHASSALALGPMILLYFVDRLPTRLQMRRPLVPFVGAVAVLGVVGLMAPQISDNLTSTLESVSYLSKYVAYTKSEQPADSVTSINHYIFLVFITFFLSYYLFLTRKRYDKANSYYIVSYIMYAAIFFVATPVAAFRQTPFWLIPLIGSFPWREAGLVGPVNALFVAASAGVFYFQFQQMYV
jgi:hypothetical protein